MHRAATELRRKSRQRLAAYPRLLAADHEGEAHLGSDDRVWVARQGKWIHVSDVDQPLVDQAHFDATYHLEPATSRWWVPGPECVICDPAVPLTEAQTLNHIKGAPVWLHASYRVPVLSGVWRAAVLISKASQFTVRLLVTHSDCDVGFYHTPTDRWEHVGLVGVDTGLVGVFNVDQYPTGEDTGSLEDETSFYGQAAKVRRIQTLKDGEGVVVSAFGGAGSFDVYVVRKARKVVAIQIVFIPDIMLARYQEHKKVREQAQREELQ